VTPQLTRLADLKAQGVLTDAEFEAQKAKVLAAG
jgi:Short C-terminal domain